MFEKKESPARAEKERVLRQKVGRWRCRNMVDARGELFGGGGGGGGLAKVSQLDDNKSVGETCSEANRWSVSVVKERSAGFGWLSRGVKFWWKFGSHNLLRGCELKSRGGGVEGRRI